MTSYLTVSWFSHVLIFCTTLTILLLLSFATVLVFISWSQCAYAHVTQAVSTHTNIGCRAACFLTSVHVSCSVCGLSSLL